MPAPYSTDLRQRVIDAYEAQQGSQRQLAKRFKVSLSFIKRLIRRYRDTGQVTPLPHGGGAIAKIRTSNLPVVEQLVDRQPDAILEELCSSFAAKSGIEVSVATMHRAVQRLNLTTKKNTIC
ncbi:helix-turn-helix domain-containing protein [Nostoc sp. PA-18-2419]|uniref:helix-turn-helix domain-containing protein n=5 Tax=Nostoc sp. PA-18-2419 TaxID=2575443 RepID=UPI00110864E3|nr:helix-turn-helix domain-containing protein [Nostoc sp. PA-18-2419]